MTLFASLRRALPPSAIALAALTLAPDALAVDGYTYGAIAYSPATGIVGYSYGMPHQSNAEQGAMDRCGPYAGDCRVVVYFGNGCGALAVGPRGWGAAWGSDRGLAEAVAMESCSASSRHCTVQRWVCSSA